MPNRQTIEYRLSHRPLFAVAVLLGGIFFALCMPAPSARAECTDPPAPGVNWRRCILDTSDHSERDLRAATMDGARLQRSDFTGANLTGASMKLTKLNETILVDANLAGADLRRADLTKANLENATLRGANLDQARFYRANLRGADLTGASLESTDFLRADLSGATWVDGKRVCSEGSVGACQ